MAGWSIDYVWIDIGQEPPRRLKLRAWGNSIIMILALTRAPELAKPKIANANFIMEFRYLPEYSSQQS